MGLDLPYSCARSDVNALPGKPLRGIVCESLIETLQNFIGNVVDSHRHKWLKLWIKTTDILGDKIVD